jgi:lysophospholipase L1-like esterase
MRGHPIAAFGVALGDSETTGAGDPTGIGWVGRYARLLHTKLGVEVDVTNLAVNGKTSAQLLADVRGDPTTRDALKDAQVVLLGIGGADLNEGDANFESGRCRAEACYAPVLKSFARNLDATVAAIRKLRGSHNTVIRSITQPNGLTGAEDVIPPFLKPVATRIGVYQAKTANRSICEVMAEYDGRCIDVLEVFNGPDGTENAYKKGLLNHEDCCYPSAKGQQLMAELLLETGLAPVR